MRMRINQFLVLTGLTVLETIRQPICLILLTACLAFIALLPALLTHTLGEGIKLVRDSALAVHLVTGLILGAYAACSTLAHEIRRGTVASVLSKPVNRELFFAAKYTGIVVVLLIYSAAISVGTLLSGRSVNDPYIIDMWSLATPLVAIVAGCAVAGILNYFLRRPFASNAFILMILFLGVGFVGVNFIDSTGQRAAFGDLVPWNLLPASILVAMAIAVLAAIAVSLATRLDVVPTLTLCTVVLLVGLMSDYLFGRLAGSAMWAEVLYALVPNWQHFWAVDALGDAEGIPWTYLVNAGKYAGVYLAAVLCLGMVAFRHMEVRA